MISENEYLEYFIKHNLKCIQIIDNHKNMIIHYKLIKKLAKMLEGVEIRLLANDLNPDVKYLKNLNAEFVSFDYLL